MSCFLQGLKGGTKISVKIVGMAVKKSRDHVNGVAQMECVAALDGLAMDVMETWVKKEGTFVSKAKVNNNTISPEGHQHLQVF